MASESGEAGLSIIEQLHKGKTELVCMARGRPYLTAINADSRQVLIYKPRCGSWGCPACAQRNRALWVARAYHGAQKLHEEGGLFLGFLTLTSHEKLGPQASLDVWPHAWKKLHMRVKREAEAFHYLLVPEQHKDGRLHVHAVETANLGSRWWKDNARACGLGFMAEETEARSAAGVASYAGKYLTKSVGYQEWPAGFRRIRVSRGWPEAPKLPAPDLWEFRSLDKTRALSDIIDHYEHRGFDVTKTDYKTAWLIINETEASEGL